MGEKIRRRFHRGGEGGQKDSEAGTDHPRQVQAVQALGLGFPVLMNFERQKRPLLRQLIFSEGGL